MCVGKTTLLNLLRGKAHYATVKGQLYVNSDRVTSLVPYCSEMGYVPQSDIMYDNLTVSENIKYAALLFNRRGYVTVDEAVPMVHHTMEILGLSAIKHSVVGEELSLEVNEW
jgi:ABC-type multidrug transport system ATPase subunit